MNKPDFSVPQRQSTKGLVLVFLQQSGKLIRAWWPVFIYLLIQVGGENRWKTLALILAAMVAVSLVHSILYFRSFRFFFEGNQFILHKGYISRKTLTIPLDRIQNVETNQSILQKLLNVMGLEIDTAGTSKKELKILALDGNTAVFLARELTNHIKNTQKGEENSSSELSEEEMVKLSNFDLLKIGISQNHFKAALLILAFGNQIFEQISDLFAEKAKEYSNEFLNFMGHSGWVIIGLIIIGFLLISFLFSMLRTLILFYDLRFLRTHETYRIVSGLLNRKNVLIPFKKIQQLDWETGPLKKLFGIYKINIKQATSDLNPRNKSIELPGCLENHLEIIKADLFGESTLDTQTKIPAHPRYFIRNWFFYGWIPAILAIPLYIYDWHYLGVGFVWIISMLIIAKLKQKKTYCIFNNEQIRGSSGSIAHRMKQMEYHKVQNVELRQSIFLKRRRIANLKIGNSSGFILLPYLDETLAKNLYDYLLYYAETSEESWM